MNFRNGMMISALCKCICVLEGSDLDFQVSSSILVVFTNYFLKKLILSNSQSSVLICRGFSHGKCLFVDIQKCSMNILSITLFYISFFIMKI